jgi:hypothetical protein
MMLYCGDLLICRLSHLASHCVWSAFGFEFSKKTKYVDNVKLDHDLLCRFKLYWDQKMQYFRISNAIVDGIY